MDIDPDIHDRLDGSFGDGPTQPPVDPSLLDRGHRALARRRRVAAVLAAAAVVAVVGGTAVVASGRTDAGRAPGVAGTTSPSPSTATGQPAPTLTSSPEVAAPSRAEARRALGLPLADLKRDGRLVIAPGATVLHRIDDPYVDTASGRSVALEVDYRGSTYWYALYRGPDGAFATTSGWSGAYPMSFGAWVESQRYTEGPPSPTGRPPHTWPGEPTTDLVRFTGRDDRLEPVGRVQILRQRPHVSVGDSFALPTDRTAAALVRTDGGQRYYVLARDLGAAPAEYIAVSEKEGGPTLTAFLDFARMVYAEGGGGLL
ncbi:hypothetical protein BH10ACT10_BH10ACT10_23190 [soil metagenome]